MSDRVDNIVEGLSLDEKAALTTGVGLWSTAAVARLGVPSINVTDGPNGARGAGLFGIGEETSVCVPCGSALGATWDPALIERVGVMLGEEALTKACRVLLAPTVNLHRSPTAGRNFECYSEDPLLSGKIAAGFVRGVQSQGVATTVKHFAGNDAEFERNSINSVIDPRALRELYLLPFELAVKEGGALGVMTAYNRLNGPHCSEHGELISAILRDEWGFTGFVVTDWLSAGSTVGSARAGVDLEMPGPGRFFGPALADAVRSGALDESVVGAQVRRLLGVLETIGALDDREPHESRSVDREDHRVLAREAATGSMVLLKNDGVLPLDLSSLRRVVVCGPNAERPQMMGGGSANLAPHYRISPLEALRAKAAGRCEIRFERGCVIDKSLYPLSPPRVTTPDGAPGFAAEVFAGDSFAGESTLRTFSNGRIMLFASLDPDADNAVSMRVRSRFLADEDGVHTFAFSQLGGRARVMFDDDVVFDGVKYPPPPGPEFMGLASAERLVPIPLTAGRTVDVFVEFSSPPGPAFVQGVRVGYRPPEPADPISRAAAAAAESDAAIVVVGTNDDWESEGADRATMDLPGEQDELVARVRAANPNTVVVVNTGSPVTMDWADDVGAIVQSWFGGQEMANALADILVGDAEPGGRLPTTIPLRLEHNPAFGNFPGENGEVRYGEGLLMGYRWYDTRRLPVRFAFGHGLSYARFVIGEPTMATECAPPDRFTVRVPVENVGDRHGAEVVQCYVEPISPRLFRPARELKAFAKVELDPGERTVVELHLDDRSFACWDPSDVASSADGDGFVGGLFGPSTTRRAEPGWYVDPGMYRIHIGRSSVDLPHAIDVTIGE